MTVGRVFTLQDENGNVVMHYVTPTHRTDAPDYFLPG